MPSRNKSSSIQGAQQTQQPKTISKKFAPLLHTEEHHPIIRHKAQLTIGQRAADIMTKFLGSWTFIFYFLAFLFLWMGVNTFAIAIRWDSYPFILLNLTLSTIAALHAPIIMMSQNRQAERDRITAKYDYEVNRKAEREIRQMQKDLEEIKTTLKSLQKTL